MTTTLPASQLYKDDEKLKDVHFAKFTSLPDDATVQRAVEGLRKKNVLVQVVDDRKAALQALVELIPGGASVMKAGSTTLEEIGWIEYLTEHPDKWDDLYAKVLKAPRETHDDVRRKAATADYFVTSVTAITEQGELTACDLTGTRIMGFNAAQNLVVVASTTKIVPTYKDAVARTYDFCLPMESARVRIAFSSKVPGSAVNNFIALHGPNPFSQAPRIHVILVKEQLGY